MCIRDRLVKHAIRVNSINTICLTKLDVLDGLETIKVCVGYKDADGNSLKVPASADQFAKITPVYKELPGWTGTTFGAKTIDELPENARAYIRFIEEAIGAPIDIISTGPDRVETIVLRHSFELWLFNLALKTARWLRAFFCLSFISGAMFVTTQNV